MAESVSKIGIISCSGEEIPEGTIARQAVRRVLEGLRPQQTVTLCLPLFLAGQTTPAKATEDSAAAGGARCSCGGPSPDGKLAMNGKSVTINGLPLIFQQLQKKGLQPGNGCADTLLKTVRVYHPIEPNEEAEYRDALVAAYPTFCERRSKEQRAGAETHGS